MHSLPTYLQHATRDEDDDDDDDDLDDLDDDYDNMYHHQGGDGIAQGMQRCLLPTVGLKRRTWYSSSSSSSSLDLVSSSCVLQDYRDTGEPGCQYLQEFVYDNNDKRTSTKTKF